MTYNGAYGFEDPDFAHGGRVIRDGSAPEDCKGSSATTTTITTDEE